MTAMPIEHPRHATWGTILSPTMPSSKRRSHKGSPAAGSHCAEHINPAEHGRLHRTHPPPSLLPASKWREVSELSELIMLRVMTSPRVHGREDMIHRYKMGLAASGHEREGPAVLPAPVSTGCTVAWYELRGERERERGEMEGAESF